MPLFVPIFGVAALAMEIPALFAALSGDYDAARPFFYGGLFFTAVIFLVAIAVRGPIASNPARGQLMSLLSAFLLMPVMLALPVVEAVPGLSFRNAYFEMVSCITTTGATVFDLPQDISPAVHLWRAMIGWYGGLLMWVAAIALLAPLRLGGTEVMIDTHRGIRDTTLALTAQSQSSTMRTLRFLKTLGPIYVVLTLVLWLGLMMLDARPLNALTHAMSTLATSGISPGEGLDEVRTGNSGEVLIALFMCFAITRVSFARDLPGTQNRRLREDPEIRAAVALVVMATLGMFLHHFTASIDVQTAIPASEALRALWGSFFTSLSFLTTTGFVSDHWTVAHQWSGLETPGLILMGLALIGGGVATTAGGVKLLRVYALYKHGELEMDRLIVPHQVATPGNISRRVETEGAYIAWLFFMIFALSIAGVMLSLSLFGVDFESAIVLTIATLSTTGPLTEFGGDAPIALSTLSAPVQVILCLAMVMGRLETLAIVALFNPAYWRS